VQAAVTLVEWFSGETFIRFVRGDVVFAICYSALISIVNRLTVAILLTAAVMFPLCLAAGLALGVYSTEFGKQLLAVATSVEEPAEVVQTTTIARKHFQLEYPSNWTLAKNDEYFDIDHYFSIDTPGYSYVLFAIWRVDAPPRDDLQDSIKYFSKLLRVSRTSSFAKWGRYSGSGVHLAGKYDGEPAEVRVFSHSSDDLTFMVTEFFDTATKHHVKSGYDLIEATFVLHSADKESLSAADEEHAAALYSTDAEK